jgi:hypothetical protein
LNPQPLPPAAPLPASTDDNQSPAPGGYDDTK